MHTRPFFRYGLLALATCASLVAQTDAEKLQQQFGRLDRNGDGAIARREFAGSDRQFAQLDKDNNGKCTYAEYVSSPLAKEYLRARYRDKAEPRDRVTALEVATARLELLERFDRNRDRRVSREEWTGTPAAFLQLDFDGNGLLDRRDLSEAEAAAPTPPPRLPVFKRALPGVDVLIRKYDKDKDDRLSARELRSQKDLLAAFPFADEDGSDALSRRELQRLADALALSQRRNMGTRPQPYDVPFDAWDKDDDGMVRQNEWQGPRGLFEQVDIDHDAAVSREEVERYIKRVRGDDFIERFDLDGNGRVTLEEFAGPPAAFRRIDKNGDGVVTRGDR